MKELRQQQLSSPRLELEPMLQSHADEMYPGLQEQALYTFIPEDPPVDLGALRKRYERLERRQSPDGKQAWLNWIVREKYGRRCLGYVQATVLLEQRTALLAYVTFKDFWRQGYTKEAVAAVIHHLFPEFGLRHMEALIDTRNAASIALVESLGFARVELLPNADHFKGSQSDEYRYRLLAPASLAMSPPRLE